MTGYLFTVLAAVTMLASSHARERAETAQTSKASRPPRS